MVENDTLGVTHMAEIVPVDQFLDWYPGWKPEHIDDPWLREHRPHLEWFEGQFEAGETAADAAVISG